MRPRGKAAAGRGSPRGAAVRACASSAPRSRSRGVGGGGQGKPGATAVRRPARADLCAVRKIGAYCRPPRPAAGQWAWRPRARCGFASFALCGAGGDTPKGDAGSPHAST